jgi:glycosyltransferase involved in cell wall biosynthesis
MTTFKILMFSADYPPDLGGISGHVYRLSRALASQGAYVTVVGGHVLPAPTSDVVQPMLREVRIRRAGPRGFRAAWFVGRAKRFLRSLQKEEWDVLHYHNIFPDGLVLRNFREAKIRIFTNHSDAFLRAHKSGRKRRWYHWLTAGASGIIAPSEEIAEKSHDFFEGNGAKIQYIPNGVDTSLFTPGPRTGSAAARLGARPGEDIILLAVRRHDPKCGLDYLIRAMPAVLAFEPRALLCMVGDGSEGPRLKSLAGEMGCAERIRFIGRLENEKIPALYRAAYLSVLPSIFEAVSLSGLEALASGCPVVGTRVGGIPAFVHDGETGLLVEPKSPSSLAEGICRLLGGPALREQMALRGRALVEQQFSWDSIARRTIEFYQERLEARNGQSPEPVLAPNGISTPAVERAEVPNSQPSGKAAD